MKRLVIDTAAIRYNISLIRQRAQGSVIYAALAGDGYGIGLVELAGILRENGIDRFAVNATADVTVAVVIRRALRHSAANSSAQARHSRMRPRSHSNCKNDTTLSGRAANAVPRAAVLSAFGMAGEDKNST